jgi:hypothetical protein
VMRYGDLNPVRAGLVVSPKDWRWSSYRHYAFGDPDDLITDAPEYLALGRTPAERREAYRQLFEPARRGDALPPPRHRARAVRGRQLLGDGPAGGLRARAAELRALLTKPG